MRIALLCLVFVTLSAFTQRSSNAAQQNVASPGGRYPYKDPSLPVEERVEDLLGRMTLDEKVAQTHSLWKGKEKISNADGTFSPEKAAAILKDGMGQITRPNEKRSFEAGMAFRNAAQHFAMEHTRLGIPIMFHEECLHGFVAEKATSYPIPIGLASSWDPQLVERIFTAVAEEARSRGAQQCLSPVVDLARDPRWGRTEETFGEDPFLVSRMGVAEVRGLQGAPPALDQKHVFATLKHFAAHGQPEGGNNVAPTSYPERIMRDMMLVPFKAAVTEAHVMSVMPSYTELDGIPAHANPWLLQKVLRQEWGFQGFISSDYFAIAQLKDIHHVVATTDDAGKLALETGVDLEFPDIDAYANLAQQIKDGVVSEATLDSTVRRILRAKFLSGLFEHPYIDEAAAIETAASPDRQKLALEAAQRSIILLKNENNTLPLDAKRLRTLAVIGPNAADIHLGGYTDPGQTGVSVLDGIRNKLAGSNVKVTYAEGARITENKPDWNADEVTPPDAQKDTARIAEAVRTARTADAVLLVIGENESSSREAWAANHLGDRDDLNLLGRQDEMVQKVMGAVGKKPVIVLHLGGRPNSMLWIAEHVPAILEGFYLGQETGPAVADVLFGYVNPGGKLPISVPRSVGQLPDYYNHKPSARRGYLFDPAEPLFRFGHGLSYTTFAYAEPKLANASIHQHGATSVSVAVTNSGKRDGDEVVEMYIRDEVSSATRPVKELRGFERVHLRAGETKTVTLPITFDSLAFHDKEMKYTVEPGTFKIMVGGSSADESLKTVVLTVVADEDATKAGTLAPR